jgi:hypothetical protein
VKVVDQLDELLRNARAATKVDRERVELFEVMVRTQAWQEYTALLNGKLQMLADQVLAPSNSVDGCIASEYVKGTMSGLVMARDIPAAIIAAKDQLRASEPVESDDDDESE